MAAKPTDLVPSGAGLAASVAIETHDELGELDEIKARWERSRSSPAATSSTRSRATRTPGRCSRPCRSRPRAGTAARRPIVLEGDVPNPINPPEACRFHPRCPRFRPGHCDVEEPQLRGFGAEHEAACHYPLERWPMSGEEIRRADEAVAAG